MLPSFILRNLRRFLTQTASRSYAKASKDCPKPKGCQMEYPKKKCQESDCLPREPGCKKSEVGAPEPAKHNPCKPMSQCCDSERLARDPCHQKRSLCEKKDLKLNRRVLPLKSTWEYPAECCGNPCPELLPRFDTLYYCASDKVKRQYQQTWVACPPIKIRKRKVCCYDPTELPPLCKRPKADCPESACELDSIKMKALCCLNQTKKCPRMRLPCCRTSRTPPLCKNPRGPTDCTKRCCPYPAFSECCHPCPPPRRPVECHCLALRSKCEMYVYLRRKLMYGLPPPLPAWPPKMMGPRY